MKLQHKLMATLVSASLVPMIFLGVIAYGNAELLLTKNTFAELNAVADLYTNRLQTFYDSGGSEQNLWLLLQDMTSLGDGGDIIVVRQYQDKALFLGSSQFGADPIQLEPMSMANDQLPLVQSLQNNEGEHLDLKDYRDLPVLAVTRYLPQPGWGIAVQVSQQEVLAPLHNLKVTLFALGVVVMIFVLGLSYLTAYSIAKPVQHLTAAAGKIADGALDTVISTPVSSDEINHLSRAFSVMTTKLKELYEGLEQKVQERTAQLEAALKDVQKFQLAVSSSTDAIMITDHERRLMYVNHAWEDLTKYTAADVYGQTLDFLETDKTDPALYEEMKMALQNGDEYHSEDIINLTKKGREYYVDLTLYPVKEGKEIMFYVGIMHDITARKKEERAKSEFVSLASHQLRTPLTAIRWGLGRLKKKIPEEQMVADVEHIFESTQRGARNMAETITTMLMISRIASGKIKLAPEECDLVDLLAGVHADFQPQCEKEDKTLTVNAPDALTFQTDPKLLREVISNLVSNAIKYSPAQKEAVVTAKQLDQQIEVVVKDSGYGIPQEQQDQVFSMFFRAENVVQKQVEGTGLGLYLVYALVTFLGGTITFESVENQGTTFTILLPLVPPENDE